MQCGPMSLVNIGSGNGLLPIRCQAITQITKCIWKWCLQSVRFSDQHSMCCVIFHFNKNFGWIKCIVTSPVVIYGKPNGLFPTERPRKRSSSIQPSPITDLLNKCGTHAWSYLRIWIAATAPQHSKLYRYSDTVGYCCFLKLLYKTIISSSPMPLCSCINNGRSICLPWKTNKQQQQQKHEPR